ncbi:hypothetical protein K2173_002211 [Erythroxylum novogranatense]|uniref:ditrans,polycis-polyprenyl diphosphate synthase [(2E,6E)-farnesyldiphosphate specific] n=1 Tax=Erythroxylum novogranatense TaxID=1862640 RepID=A0AAV8TAZ6_9ROSI|nr:hypothetical protein K2173_002211 [Erythroxylum novogranatense]
MDSGCQVQRVHSNCNRMSNLGLRLLWHFVHLLVNLWYFGVSVAGKLESYVISCGLLKRYKDLKVDHIKYLAVVVESEDAYQIDKITELLQWLEAIGVKNLCLYDVEGILKKSKKSIIEKLKNAVLLEEYEEEILLKEQNHMTLEFASISDGNEMVAKAANLLFVKYMKFASSSAQGEIFTEAHLGEALRTVGQHNFLDLRSSFRVNSYHFLILTSIEINFDILIGCKGQDPDLMLVYGPVRCHLGFPAWRIRYTEIIHMGPLKSMRYGSLMKAMHKFTLVHQNYGK